MALHPISDDGKGVNHKLGKGALQTYISLLCMEMYCIVKVKYQIQIDEWDGETPIS